MGMWWGVAMQHDPSFLNHHFPTSLAKPIPPESIPSGTETRCDARAWLNAVPATRGVRTAPSPLARTAHAPGHLGGRCV